MISPSLVSVWERPAFFTMVFGFALFTTVLFRWSTRWRAGLIRAVIRSFAFAAVAVATVLLALPVTLPVLSLTGTLLEEVPVPVWVLSTCLWESLRRAAQSRLWGIREASLSRSASGCHSTLFGPLRPW